MKRCGAMRLVAVLVAWASTVCAQKASSVVCVGDSITWGRTDGKHGDLAEDGSEAYPFQLEEKLGWSHWEVRNLGVSGATAQDIKGDGYVNYKEEEYAEALEAAADYYVVILGTNDAKTAHWNASSYEAAIVDLCESFASVGGAVVLGAPPPGQKKGDSTSLQRGCSRSDSQKKSIHALSSPRERIARPKMSQNEWKTTEIQASKVGNFSPFSCRGASRAATRGAARSPS